MPIQGFGIYEIEDENRVSGGWWLATDVPDAVTEDPANIAQNRPGMASSSASVEAASQEDDVDERSLPIVFPESTSSTSSQCGN